MARTLYVTASGLALHPSPPLGGHAGGGHVAGLVPSSHAGAMVSSVASACRGVVVHEAEHQGPPMRSW